MVLNPDGITSVIPMNRHENWEISVKKYLHDYFSCPLKCDLFWRYEQKCCHLICKLLIWSFHKICYTISFINQVWSKNGCRWQNFRRWCHDSVLLCYDWLIFNQLRLPSIEQCINCKGCCSCIVWHHWCSKYRWRGGEGTGGEGTGGEGRGEQLCARNYRFSVFLKLGILVHFYRHFWKIWSNGISQIQGLLIFELQAKTGKKFLMFTLFLNFKESFISCNQTSDWGGVWIRM